MSRAAFHQQRAEQASAEARRLLAERETLRGCEKTLAYCDRLRTPAAALRYAKSRVI